jgi:septal ring factor EnvC (AmiA/AmiB activator)
MYRAKVMHGKILGIIRNYMSKFLRILFITIMVVVSSATAFAQTSDVDSRRRVLEAELAKIEAEIKVQEAELEKQKGQTGSLTRDINVLTSEINAKKLEIQKKNRLLGDLESEIRGRNQVLNNLGQELTREKRSLAHMLRQQYQLEDYSIAETLLQGSTISEFFKDVDSFASIKAGLKDSFGKIQNNQQKTEQEKKLLETKKEDEVNTKKAIEQDKKKVEQKQGEKQGLLVISKTKEKSYEQVLVERRAAAASIRQALFQLRGVSGGALNFGQVYACLLYTSPSPRDH